MKTGVSRAGVCRIVLAVACGSCGGGSASSSLPAAGSVQNFAADYCNLLVPCCAKAGLSGSSAYCQALVEGLSAGQNYNAGAGQACIAATQQASASPTFCTTPGGGTSCRNVFSSGSGNKAPGQPCATSGDCAPAAGGSATCWIQTTFVDGGTTSSGTCVQLLAGQAGQGPCIETISGNLTSSSGFGGNTSPPAQAYSCDVADGVSCNSATRKCTTLGATGQPCMQDVDCVAGDYCLHSFTAAGSTCAARIADGASCTGAASNGCLSTSRCDPASHTCNPLLPGGSACTLDQQCTSYRCTNGTCTGSTTGVTIFCGR